MALTRRIALLWIAGIFFAVSSAQAGDVTKISIKNMTSLPATIIGVSVDVNPVYFQGFTRMPWFGANGGAFLNLFNTAEFRVSAGSHVVYAINADSAVAFASATITATTVTVKKGKTLQLRVTGSGNSLVISEL